MIRFWDVAAGRVVGTLRGHTALVGSMSFSPDGRLLATASGPPEALVRLWDVSARREVAQFGDNTSWAGPVAFSPDGRFLANCSGASNYVVNIGDVAARRKVTALKGNSDQIDWVGFSPDGRTLATSSQDGTLRFWSVASWTQALTLGDAARSDPAAFSPDGRLLFTGQQDGTIRIWRAASLVEADQQAELEWHQRALDEAIQNRNWPTALQHLDWLVQQDPTDAGQRAGRGEVDFDLHRWAEAAADFGRAAALDPDNLWYHLQQALAQLAMGDQAGYQRTCAAMLERVTERPTGGTGVAAWPCALGPDALPDLSRPVRIAEQMVANKPDDGDELNTLGAILYRAGRFAAAVRRLNEAVVRHAPNGVPEDSLFLAMAHARLGHAAEARRWLDRAARESKVVADRNAGGELLFRLLRREAEQTVSARRG